jgi:anti-anti-sigma regulatory factor
MIESCFKIDISVTEVNQSLVINLPAFMTIDTLGQIKESIANHLRFSNLRAIILDLSACKVIDCSEFFILKDIALATNLLDCLPIFVGIQPGVAAYLACNNTDFSNLTILSNINVAYDYLSKSDG